MAMPGEFAQEGAAEAAESSRRNDRHPQPSGNTTVTVSFNDLRRLIQEEIEARLPRNTTDTPSDRVTPPVSTMPTLPTQYDNRPVNNGVASMQFRPRDIGYFDPSSDLKEDVTIKDKDQVYRNVFSFTNRVRVKATTMDPALIRNNLDTCLLGRAKTWYTEELSHIQRVGLRMDPSGVEEWCRHLKARFRESPGRFLVALESTRYTIQDVQRRRDPADFVQQIVLHGKNS